MAFENERGQVLQITGQSLARLFECCVSHVRCVVLNACYSEVQANAIVQHIDYVIGMNKAVGDEAAIKFAEGFYDALLAGRPYDLAFKFGCTAIDLRGIPEHLTPVLKKRQNLDPAAAGSAGPREPAAAVPRNSWKSTGRRGWDSTRCSRVGTDRPRSSRGGTGCQGSGRLPGPPGLHPGTKTGQERLFDQAALRGARRGDLVGGAAEAISRIHAPLGASRPDHLTGFLPASSWPWTG